MAKFTLLVIYFTIGATTGQNVDQDLIAVFDSLQVTPELRRLISAAPIPGAPSASGPGAPGTPGAAGQPGIPSASAPSSSTLEFADTSIDKLSLFTAQTEDPVGSTLTSFVASATESLARIKATRGLRGPSFQLGAIENEVQKAINCLLPPREPCDPSYKYRVPDGTCNNPDTTVIRGASLTAQGRFLEPEYGDVLNIGSTPRINGKNGKLRSPREISNEVFSTTPDFASPFSNRYTVTLTHFAQFIDHDVIKTPVLKMLDNTTADPFDEVPIKDCHRDCDTKRAECMTILIPDGDENFENIYGTRCLPLVRSKPAIVDNCRVGPRQQLNERTSFLDLSASYGSSKNHLNQLRGPDGRLNASKNDLLPFGPAISDCLADIQQCFNSGDDRHQEIPMLTIIHIVFLREHNRIAGELKQLNKKWNSDKLFNEARKILTGMYQHIVYNEFLPLLVGRQTAFGAGLLSRASGHSLSYNQWVDPSTLNEFGAAAYRFGHSLVGRFVGSLDKNFQQKAIHELRFDFFNNSVTVNRDNNGVPAAGEFGPTRIGRWMSSTFMRERDRVISDQVRNHLFESNRTFNGPKSDGFDLAAFNIQRGRDHGIPGYNKYREYCGLFPAAVFNAGPMGFRDHDLETINRLSKVYRHPDDIDLFAGGISERPSQNGDILGPTFKCLVTLQFQRYKEGDRFFYENPYFDIGFKLDQLNDIKRQTFAGMYCRSLGLETIQRKVFESPDSQNPPGRVKCNSLPSPNLDLWKE